MEETKNDDKEDSKTVEDFIGHQCQVPPEKLYKNQITCGDLRRFWLEISTVNVNDIRAIRLYRSHAALCEEKYRNYQCFPLSIHPYSKFRYWLEATFTIALTLSNVLVTIHFTKNDPIHYADEFCIPMFISDILYLLNVIINFFTGYIEGHTNKLAVMDLKRICIRYTRTWFIIDVLSSTGFISGFIDEKFVTLQTFLVASKILRLPVIIMYLDNVLTVRRTGIKIKTTLELMFLVLSYLTWNMFFQFANEYIAEGSYEPVNPRNCSWITIGKLWQERSSARFFYSLDRANRASLKERDSIHINYLALIGNLWNRSLVECRGNDSNVIFINHPFPHITYSHFMDIGMLSKNANMNLINQGGCFETFFIISWLIAKLLVIHCALKYTISAFGSESAQAKYYIMMKQVETYMDIKNFPPRIKQRVMKFYAIRFQSNFFTESRMLSSVSAQLHEDIVLHTSQQLVKKCKFVKDLPKPLLLQVALRLRLVIFIAGDIIFKINTFGDCLYFIDKGSIAIYTESGKEICHSEDGEYFGTISLITGNLRPATAVAITNCELLKLDREDFEMTIAIYPTVYEDMKKEALHRYETLILHNEHHKTELKMADEHRERQNSR